MKVCIFLNVLAIQFILQTNSFDNFLITGLKNNRQYEAMVCYANMTNYRLPRRGQFSAECGYCKICFTAKSTTSKAIIIMVQCY